MRPFTLQDVLTATGGQGAPSIAAFDTPVTAVSTDSRHLAAGALFVPLVGPNFDGHKFITSALQSGAVAALTQQAARGRVIRVPATLPAYQHLARWYRRQATGCVVAAVTGSNGKTLTKDLLAHLLTHTLGRVIKTPANLNNEIGLPQTLFLIEADTRAAVVEMGMRGRGQIAELAAIAEPHIGIITTVGEAHLELLGSREAIADAKAELLVGLAADGTAVLPRDNPYFERLRGQAHGRVLTFGVHADADVRLVDFQPLGWQGSQVRMAVGRRQISMAFPLLGRHLVDNLLAAVAACHALDLVVEPDVLEGFTPSGQRLEPVQTRRGAAVLNDAYNASPTSVRGALRLLPSLPCEGRRIAVLGDMLELGPIETAAHEDVGREAAQAGVDVLVAVGARSRAMAEAFQHETGGHRRVLLADNAQQATGQVLDLVQPDDLVLVKASHGMGLESVVEALQANA